MNRIIRSAARLITASGALLAASSLLAAPAFAETNHAIEYAINTNGGIAVAANTSMTCDASSADCDAALNGTATGTNLNNNRFPGVYVDVDSDASTFSSSSAQLDLPNDATVLYAILTWGGDSTNASRNTVQLRTPSSGVYAPVVAATVSTRSPDNYAAWVDITSQVATAGSGTYSVANVRGDVGRGDSYAGWQIVVAYRDSASPARNLAVFSGYRAISSQLGGTATININGFQTPAVGNVNSRVSVLGFEGDLGLTGDRLQLETQYLTDGVNPSTNAFNSTISEDGSLVTSRDITPLNNLGIDSDTFVTTNVIANNATDADVTLTTTNDVYFVSTVAVATDLYAPRVDVDKTAVDENGGVLLAGDTVAYQISVTNNGADGATDVTLTDLIPTNTSYVPGSITITQPGGAGTGMTDAGGDDAGEYSAVGGNHIDAYLGAGATSAAGGLILPGETAIVSFRVQVDPALVAGGQILNTARVSSNGQTIPSSVFENSSNNLLSVEGLPITSPDLVVEILQASVLTSAGVTGSFDIQVTNQGNGSAANAEITGTIGTKVTSMSISGSPGACSVNTTTGTFTCSLGNMNIGDTHQLTVSIKMSTSGTRTFTTSVSTPTTELLLTNNDDSLAMTVRAGRAALRSTVQPASRTVRAGKKVRVTATLRNTGNASAVTPRLCVTIPAGMSIANRGGGSLSSGQLCWTWSSLAAGGTRSVAYTLRASTTVRSRKKRYTNSNGSATNAANATDSGWMRIVGGVSGAEPVTG